MHAPCRMPARALAPGQRRDVNSGSVPPGGRRGRRQRRRDPGSGASAHRPGRLPGAGRARRLPGQDPLPNRSQNRTRIAGALGPGTDDRPFDLQELSEDFIPEGAGRRQGVAACSFAVGWLLPGMAAWPYGWLSLIGAGFARAGWRVRDRAEPGRAAAPQASLTRSCEPMMAGAGERPRACARAMRLWAPHRRLCGWQACWLPSSLRVCPGLAGRGAWGGFASRGGRGQSRFRSRRRSGWCRLRRGAQDLAAARPSGPAAHAAALVARRMCPSRMP